MPPIPRSCVVRARRLEAMRAISRRVDWWREQELVHRPPWGSIGVGGADFDYLLKATVGEAYLRVLRRGGTPDEARAEAIADGSECVRTWNTKSSKSRASVAGQYELQRYERAGAAEADAIHLWFIAMMRDAA